MLSMKETIIETITKAISETKASSPERAHRIENIVDTEMSDCIDIDMYSSNLSYAMKLAKTASSTDHSFVAEELAEEIIIEYGTQMLMQNMRGLYFKTYLDARIFLVNIAEEFDHSELNDDEFEELIDHRLEHLISKKVIHINEH